MAGKKRRRGKEHGNSDPSYDLCREQPDSEPDSVDGKQCQRYEPGGLDPAAEIGTHHRLPAEYCGYKSAQIPKVPPLGIQATHFSRLLVDQ